MEKDLIQRFVDNIRHQTVAFPRLRESNYERVATSFQALSWAQSAEDMSSLRLALERPWRMALVETWRLSRNQIGKLVGALGDCESILVNSVLVSLAQDVLEDNDPALALCAAPQRRRTRLEDSRVSDVRVDDKDFVNFLRLLNIADFSGVGGSPAADLEPAIKRSELPSLFTASLRCVKGHAEKFLIADVSPGRFGSHSHVADFRAAKERTRALVASIESAFEVEVVELICRRVELLQVLCEEFSRTFVSVVIAFAHIEARWLIFHHPSTMGKILGREILSLRKDLCEDSRGLNSQVRSAGLLLAALDVSKDYKLLQDLKGLSSLLASGVPALGTVFNAEMLHREIRKQGYDSVHDANLVHTAPRPERSCYAHPPPQARVNGHFSAPLSGSLDIGGSVEDWVAAIDNSWASRPVREAIVAINASTLMIWTWRLLPGLRKSGHHLADWNIPLVHQRFLSQCTLAGANQFLREAEGEHQYLKNIRWRIKLEEEIDLICNGDDDHNMKEFTDWVRGWRCPRAAVKVTCGCSASFMVGKDPLKGLLTHLKSAHSNSGRRAKYEQDRQIKSIQTYQGAGGQSVSIGRTTGGQMRGEVSSRIEGASTHSGKRGALGKSRPKRNKVDWNSRAKSSSDADSRKGCRSAGGSEAGGDCPERARAHGRSRKRGEADGGPKVDEDPIRGTLCEAPRKRRHGPDPGWSLPTYNIPRKVFHQM